MDVTVAVWGGGGDEAVRNRNRVGKTKEAATGVTGQPPPRVKIRTKRTAFPYYRYPLLAAAAAGSVPSADDPLPSRCTSRQHPTSSHRAMRTPVFATHIVLKQQRQQRLPKAYLRSTIEGAHFFLRNRRHLVQRPANRTRFGYEQHRQELLFFLMLPEVTLCSRTQLWMTLCC